MSYRPEVSLRRYAIPCLALVLGLVLPAPAGDLILNDPAYPTIGASALDQPELDAVLADGGTVITDGGEPVIFDAFIDTGASSFVISYLQANGYNSPYILPEEAITSLGLDGVPAGEFIGVYTEIGVGGTELGDVTRQFAVRLLNGVPGTGTSANLDQFVDYGLANLWVRQAAGPGEKIWVLEGVRELVDPFNIVGMPVIGQRVMVMDPTPLAIGDRMETYLLTHGHPDIPATNLTFDVRMQSYAPTTPPPGEVLPTYADNPLIQHVSITHMTNSVEDMEWLFDTGSGSTFVSFAVAQAAGLIPDTYATLEAYLVDHIAAGGWTQPVGGIGPSVTAPLLTLDRISVLSQEGINVVWENVDILVVDIPGLDAVFGMNLLMPAVTIDPADPLGWFDDITPGYFEAMVFDAQNEQLELFSSLVPEPAGVILLAVCGIAAFRRRR